ncbi:FMN-dependent NADH-azoreductase [Sphingomonas sp. DT-51]|uniref:FMN-dependent NADH-azoreductase n=1 Tax=Sphingomonas sp. DT-51 TaxID=3396165 RepID=UPI003F1BB4E3
MPSDFVPSAIEPAQEQHPPEICPRIILHLDSSLLAGHSATRLLSAQIVARQQSLHSDATVIYRDLAVDAPVPLTSKHIAVLRGGAFATSELQTDLASGAAYIDDLYAADIIVIGAPMYNFSVPAQLKAWIDRVSVAGRTFQYTAAGPVGLLPKGKRAFIASARGGVYSGESAAASMDHQESYLQAVLGFMGVSDISVVRAEGLNMGDEVRSAALAKAAAQITALVD